MAKEEAEELAQTKISKAIESEAAKRAKAQEQYAEQLAQAEEQYIKQVQAAQEEADRKNKAARDEALNTLRSEAKEFEAFLKGGYKGLQEQMYKNLIKSGVNPEHLKQMTPEKLEQYKAAKEQATNSFLP